MIVVEMREPRGSRRKVATLLSARKKTREAMRKSWFKVGDDLKREASRQVLDRGSKRGRVYLIRGPGGVRRHRASAPGQSHANLSGRLRRSLSWKVQGSDELEFGYGVASSLTTEAPDHAPFVEFGTRNMKARPTLRNAIESEGERSVREHFARALLREFRF